MDDLPTPVLPPARPRKRRSPNQEDAGADAEGVSEDKSMIKNPQTSPDKPSPLLYYMLTPALPEDKELRSKLWNSRLVSSDLE